MPILGQTNSKEDLHQSLTAFGLDPENIPTHVACVMDGNGRWAEEKGKPRLIGHKAGADALKKILKNAADLGIRYLSVYAFSTENWSRPKTEVSFLMKLFDELLDREVGNMHKEGVRIRFSGRYQDIPQLQKRISAAEKLTENNTVIQFNVMLNYGGRQELVDAVNSWLTTKSEGEAFSEEAMQNHLYVPEAPDPDLWIRTSGEYRLSNYMLWQSAYSELVFEPTLWPDFTMDTLVKCVLRYQERHRRFGGL